MAEEWRVELAEVVRLMRDLSLEKDPWVASKMYAERLRRGLIPADAYVAVSIRNMQRPAFRITRYSGWEEQLNPWTQGEKLPRFEGGILSELAYADEPVVWRDLKARLRPDDPAYEYLRGMNFLMTLPQYEEGVALNTSILLARDCAAFPEERIPFMVWQANLFGRSTRNLMLKEEVKAAYDALDRELKVVAEIQKSLLPASLPDTAGVTWAADYRTSARAGGDYYDFFRLPDERLGIFLADVSGHGTPAAVMMAVTHAIAHGYCGPHVPAGEVLSHVNRVLAGQYTKGSGTFVTAFYGVYDPASGRLTYANAGHPAPRWLRAGEVRGLEGDNGLPLGVDIDELYDESVAELRSGDCLLFYTDGITEAADRQGRLLGTPRLDDIICRCTGASDMVHEVIAAVNRFTDGQPAGDDRTLLAMRVE